MKRAALLLVLALTVAACGGSQVIASVNTNDITLEDVETLSPQGDSGSIESNQFTQLLGALIQHWAVVDYAESELSITASDDAITLREDELLAQFAGAPDVSVEEQLAAQNATLEFVRIVAWQQVIQADLLRVFEEQANPSDEELQTLYDQNQQSLSNVCASHILFLTQPAPDATEEDVEQLEADALANAEAALERAQAGEDFAELAIELSEGPSGPDGGDLGCAAPSDYVPEFANATLQANLNQPFGPVRTQFGYHIVLVTEREVPELDEVRDVLLQQYSQTAVQESFNTFVNEALAAADVTVDEQYGVWIVGDAIQRSQLVPPPT